MLFSFHAFIKRTYSAHDCVYLNFFNTIRLTLLDKKIWIKKLLYKVPNIDEKFTISLKPHTFKNFKTPGFKINYNPIFGKLLRQSNENYVRRPVTLDTVKYQSPFLLKSNVLAFLLAYSLTDKSRWIDVYYKVLPLLNSLFTYLLDISKRTFGEGYVYLRGLFIIFFIDACLTDDEPLWEPVEWSLVQSWIMFIFFFAWVAENLITSRYGSYTGRDKRVWAAWYRVYWMVEGWYVLSMGAAACFVIVPFYHELNYSMAFVFSWWNWYSRVFFFKFISSYCVVLYIAYYLQLNMRWFHWKKSMMLVILVNLFLSYLLYTHFFMSFFGYFTNPNWHKQTRVVDYIQLSHEPHRWDWGAVKRDHFSYHRTPTVFWFKNDGPFASAFLFFHFMFFFCLFTLYIYWIVLARRLYCTQELTYTYTVYCVSALRQFLYFFFLLYILVIMSFVVCYWRFPVEFFWLMNSYPLASVATSIMLEYPQFILSLLF